MNTTANAVLDVFETKGLYQAKKVNGGYKVVRLKLDKSKANMLRSIFNQLDENGMNSSERLELIKQTNEKIQRYEALQNSLH